MPLYCSPSFKPAPHPSSNTTLHHHHKLVEKTTHQTPIPITMSNPRVFFDITIGGAPSGRIVMELFADVVPNVSTPPSESALSFFPRFSFCRSVLT